MSTTNAYRDKDLGTISPADIPVDMLPEVELSHEQLCRAAALAYERNFSYKEIGGGDVYSRDSLMSHLVGIVGEMAVALAYQTDIDEETYVNGDDGIDLELFDNPVDVKATTTTRMERPELLVKEDKKITANIFFLVHIIEWGPESATVRLHGYAPRDIVTSREPRRHPGHDLNYVVEPHELTLPPLVQTCL